MIRLLKSLYGTPKRAFGVQGSDYYDEAFTRPEWREHYVLLPLDRDRGSS
jgi:hypothetical protein